MNKSFYIIVDSRGLSPDAKLTLVEYGYWLASNGLFLKQYNSPNEMKREVDDIKKIFKELLDSDLDYSVC